MAVVDRHYSRYRKEKKRPQGKEGPSTNNTPNEVLRRCGTSKRNGSEHGPKISNV